ncbi:MAG: aminotransferase class V-fold PLP-dependent enzyme [Clostridia bacterium]|nr:aminotransferase class V-fold PLP-dependent enzyme [Clostridia bacterium]
MISEKWVTDLEKEFPVAGRFAYFDIAYENCGADFHREALEQYLVDKQDLRPDMVKAGGNGKGRTIEVVERTREKLGRLIGADSRNIAFTLNTTQGMDIILQGFKFSEGDKVIVSSLEHVAVLIPVLGLREKGVRVEVIEPLNGYYVTAEQYMDAIDDDTRMVVFSYVQSNCGYRIDAEKLIDACHEKNVFAVSDVIQAIGFTDIDINRLRFDAMCACCYKGLLGPEGVGFVYVRDELLRGLVPVFSGASAGTSLDRQTMEVTFDDLNASKLEAGTLPFIGIYMLEKGLDRLLSIGMADITKHIRECFNVIRDGLAEAGYETAFEYTDVNSCHSMLIKVEDCDEAYRYFTESGVYVSKSLNDTLRVSVAPFTTEKSIDRLLSVAKKYLHHE